MAEPCDRPDPQAIPEATEEGHLSEFRGPGGDEDIGLDLLKNVEQEWQIGRIMLTVGIQRDDHLIVLPEDRFKSRPEGGPLAEVKGMFQEFNSMV
jgi:hypothetical protein